MPPSSVRWNYSHEPHDRPEEPEYNVPIGDPSPPLTAFGNIQYLDMIKILKGLWEASHPEVQFRSFADNNEYDPENGYIIHSVVQKVPKDGNSKPNIRHTWKDEEGKSYTTFLQSFIHTIRFTATHTDPDVADEIIEAFEEFMMEAIPFLKKQGIEDIFYYQRIPDVNQTRVGEDLPVRSTEYRITTQKLYTIQNAVLAEYYLQLQIKQQATPNMSIAVSPEDGEGSIYIYDTKIGHGPPSSYSGFAPGDVYIDVDTGLLYVWESN